MCEDKMVTKEELKDILVDEQVKKIYDSIDYKELDRLEQENHKFNEYIKKDLHPMSYTINKEYEEWERSAPLFKDLMNIEMMMLGLSFAHFGMWFFIGFVVVVYAILGS
jgi:CRISPR/Cas system CSM-associated protein Csm2 small subunit